MIKKIFWVVGAALALLTIQLSCVVRYQKNAPFTATAKIRFQIPMVRSSGDLKVFEDSFYLTQYSDLVILQSPLNHFYETPSGRIDTVVQYQYFMYALHDTTGFLFDSLGASPALKVNVDSFMHLKAFGGGLQLFDADNMRLLHKKWLSQQKLQQFVYVPMNKPDAQYGDTCFAYFKKNVPSLPFTLSSYLDGLGYGKLVRMDVIIAQQHTNNELQLLPSRRFSFSVLPVSVMDSHRLQQLKHMYEIEKTASSWFPLEELF